MNLPETAAAAVEYVRHGWALTAFNRGEKGPNWTGWNAPESAITTEGRCKNLHANIGLLHAYSGTCTLDLDDIEAARPWFKERGIDLDALINAPDAVRIDRGHPNKTKLVYQLERPLPSCMLNKHGFELRCASSTGRSMQCCLPPSVHPDGSQYRWIGDWRSLPLLPASLCALWDGLKSKPDHGDAKPLGVGNGELEELLESYDPSSLEYDEWLAVGMALHHETGGGPDGLALWDAWSSRSPKYQNGYQEPKYQSFDAGHANPITLKSIVAKARRQLDATREFTASPTATPPPASRFAFRRDAELMDRPPMRWWIAGVLPKAEIAMVYGASGSGKSFLVYDMAAAIAQGLEWCGRKTVRGRVARIVAEGSAGDRNRKAAYAKGNGGALPGMIELHAPIDLQGNDHVEIARQIEIAGGADIIVIDTLTAAAPHADETRKDMGSVIDHCRKLAAATRATIIWVHHAGKNPELGARGTSSLKAAVDQEIEVTANGAVRFAEITKSRDGETGTRFAFKLIPVDLGHDLDGNLMSSCVVEHVAPPAPKVAPPRRPKGDLQELIWDALPDLWGLTGTTTIAALVESVLPSVASSPGGRDTRKQKILAALQKLNRQKFVEIDGLNVRCA